MNRHLCAGVALAAVMVWYFGQTVPVDAHRLDEYLQAARLSVSMDRVSLEMDLTAGIAVAPAVFATIDLDRSGEISPAEGGTYARHVLDSLVLTVDGRPVHPRLEGSEMPAWRDISRGVGVIRLLASATVPAVTAGTHRIYFRNTHRSDTSVYLANALVPTDGNIEITRQRRDTAQHELTIDYQVMGGSPSPWRSSWGWAAGLAAVLAAAWLGLRRRRWWVPGADPTTSA